MKNKEELETTKIITVTPISKGVFKESLSYFSLKELEVGTVVSIDIKNKKHKALIIDVQDAKKEKTKLRGSSFSLKKIDGDNSKQIFSGPFVEAATETASFFASTIGQVLNKLIPEQILTKSKSQPRGQGKSQKHGKGGISIIQTTDDERFGFYKSIIRTNFAKNSSVFICLPTINAVEQISEILQKGIEQYTIILHGQLTSKEIEKRWKNAASCQHPILIISTPMFLSIQRGDIATIIIENESSRSYVSMTQPFIDFRFFIKKFAEKVGATLILGDLILDIDTVWRQDKDGYNQIMPIKKKFLTETSQETIDLKNYKPLLSNKNVGYNKDDALVVISDELKKIISDSIKRKEKAFLLCSRKGLAPMTICCDCGSFVVCADCQTLLTLYNEPSGPIFECSKCDKKISADKKCDKCQSWRLKTLGLGIEKAQDEIKKIFPDIEILVLDKKTSKTHAQIKKIINKFYETDNIILLGTSMAIPYLKKIDHGIVVSIDSLFSLPNIKMNENIFQMLLRLREKSSKTFLIQTRKPEKEIFKLVLNGDFANFYKEEISLRESLKIPPFSINIKIELAGKKTEVETEINQLAKYLAIYNPLIYEGRPEQSMGHYHKNMLISLDPQKWPLEYDKMEPKLQETLKSLPPRFKIYINPENII